MLVAVCQPQITIIIIIIIIIKQFLLLRPGRGAVYCDQPVCVCVCQHISGTAQPIFIQFCMQIPCDYGSVILWRRSATLCTSGFMDDVTFGRNWRDAETWRLHHAATATSGVAIPRYNNCTSFVIKLMNACWSLCTIGPTSCFMECSKNRSF